MNEGLIAHFLTAMDMCWDGTRINDWIDSLSGEYIICWSELKEADKEHAYTHSMPWASRKRTSLREERMLPRGVYASGVRFRKRTVRQGRAMWWRLIQISKAELGSLKILQRG